MGKARQENGDSRERDGGTGGDEEGAEKETAPESAMEKRHKQGTAPSEEATKKEERSSTEERVSTKEGVRSDGSGGAVVETREEEGAGLGGSNGLPRPRQRSLELSMGRGSGGRE